MAEKQLDIGQDIDADDSPKDAHISIRTYRKRKRMIHGIVRSHGMDLSNFTDMFYEQVIAHYEATGHLRDIIFSFEDSE